MTAYYVQHQGDYINKLVAFTGAKEGITPAPDRPDYTVTRVDEGEYMVLQACHGNLDTLLKMAKSIVDKVNRPEGAERWKELE